VAFTRRRLCGSSRVARRKQQPLIINMASRVSGLADVDVAFPSLR
jgi:hypothetical protein